MEKLKISRFRYIACQILTNYEITNTNFQEFCDQLRSVNFEKNCQVEDSSKKRTNEFIFTSMRCVFVRFLEEIEDSKKAFQNYLTFN